MYCYFSTTGLIEYLLNHPDRKIILSAYQSNKGFLTPKVRDLLVHLIINREKYTVLKDFQVGDTVPDFLYVIYIIFTL